MCFCVSAAAGTGRLALGLVGTPGIFYISDITQYLDHDKSSSILQIINGKSRDLQNLRKYFNGTATSTFNLLPFFDVLAIIFVL